MKTWFVIALAGLTGALFADPVKLDVAEQFGKQNYAVADGDTIIVKGGKILAFREKFAFNPKAKYTLSCEIKLPEGAKAGLFLAGYYCYDKDGKQLAHNQVMAYSGTGTKLAADVKAGDTVIKIENGAKWVKNVNAFAAFHAKEDFSDLPNSDFAANIVNVAQVNGVWEVTLGKPAAKDYPAGTGVREHAAGGYLYAFFAKPKNEWTKYSGTLSGMPAIGNCRINPAKNFWPCTAEIRPVFLANWGSKDAQVQIRNVTIEEVK